MTGERESGAPGGRPTRVEGARTGGHGSEASPTNEQAALLVARNRATQPELLRRLAGIPNLTRNREIRRAIVLHPNTPLPVARNLVPYLFWRELVEVTRDLKVNPLVRRHAEMLLRVRLEKMALGERIALARQASPALIPVLLTDAHARVLQSLLGNSRLVERHAVSIGGSRSATPDLLEHLALRTHWGKRPSVRGALLRNPRTPVATSLKLLRDVARRDLKRLARDASLPQIVRIGADRRLGLQRTDATCGAQGR